jgi:hypothetical protein
VRTSQLVLAVANTGYRRVLRKAGVQRRRPFCVVSPVLPTTCGVAESLFLATSDRGATPAGRSGVAPGGQFRQKLSVVSDSRAGRVNGCCERSIARNPLHIASRGGRSGLRQPVDFPVGGVAEGQGRRRRHRAHVAIVSPSGTTVASSARGRHTGERVATWAGISGGACRTGVRSAQRQVHLQLGCAQSAASRQPVRVPLGVVPKRQAGRD